MSKLLNYSTKITPEQTIGEIQRMLDKRIQGNKKPPSEPKYIPLPQDQTESDQDQNKDDPNCEPPEEKKKINFWLIGGIAAIVLLIIVLALTKKK